VTIAGARLRGTPVERIDDGDAVIAIRPEDLTARAEGPIAATVATAEYRGREFYGTARAADGTELFFRSEQPVAPGEALKLGADPSRVLIYAGGGG
jgi:putative spermidine/putrescine transport system ATP-binding protein